MKPPSGKLSSLSLVRTPTWCSPKFDGIRECKQDGTPLTYNLKKVPNIYVNSLLLKTPNGLDGELVSNDFNSTQSAIMTHGGKPAFTFFVFDFLPQTKTQQSWTYLQRVESLMLIRKKLPEWIVIVEPQRIDSTLNLIAYEEWCIKNGYEGCIGRTDSLYKHGRATHGTQAMWRFKRFEDAEGIIVAVNERISVHGKPLDTAGAVQIKAKWGIVTVGGFTAEFAADLWHNFHKYKGKKVTFRYQVHGTKDKPRFGTWKGLRYD